MSRDNEISEILSSLNNYIEKQERLLEEKNSLLLEQGRKEFEAAIAERKARFEKATEEVLHKGRTIRKRRNLSSIVTRQALIRYHSLRHLLSKLLYKIRDKLNSAISRRD